MENTTLYRGSVPLMWNNNSEVVYNGTTENSESIILRSMLCVVGIVGFIANLLVIGVISTSSKMMKRHTSWFLINQSVLDLLTSGLLAACAFKQRHLPAGLAGHLYCKLWLSEHFLWVCAMASTYNLMMITLERYCSAAYPVWHKNHVSGSVVVVGLVLPWIVGNVYNLFTPILARVEDNQCKMLQYKSERDAMIVGIMTFIVQFFLPLLVMIFCYARIFMIVSRQGRSNTALSRIRSNAVISLPSDHESSDLGSSRSPGATPTSSVKVTSRKSRAKGSILRTLISVCAAFVLCWAWNQIFFLLYSVGVYLSFTGEFYYFTAVAAHLNCALNPFIYAAKYREFKKAYMALLRIGRYSRS